MKFDLKFVSNIIEKVVHRFSQSTDNLPAGLYDIYQSIPMEIAVYDLQGKYKFVNSDYAGTPEISQELVGKDDGYFAKLKGISPDSLIKRRNIYRQLLEQKKLLQYTEKLYFPSKNQTLYYKRIFQPLFSNNGNKELTGVCMFGSSLTHVIHAQKELEYLVYHDKLTGLKNRNAFYESLDQILMETDPEQEMIAILICDIDNFKAINDKYGHKTADFCLTEIARKISEIINKTDQIFRVGGDEFALILRNINNEYDASRVAEKIITEVTKPYEIFDQVINYLMISIGIVIIPKDGNARDTLIQRASDALKNAKRIKNSEYSFFSEELTIKSMRRLEMESKLRLIINENSYDQQFQILYQPIVEKKQQGDYRIIGCEALLRWHNPDLGSVSPNIFIPLAEDTDLICQLGDWVLYKAIKDFKEMIERVKKPVHLSVNFSAKQMKDSKIVSKIDKIVQNTGITPADLHLEITETSLLDEGLQVIQNINDIEKLGLKIVIDDFGVGFASLRYLQKFPVSIIKIDRSFVQHINQSHDHKKLVESIILLGQNLNKDIIAEGVENLEHLYVLYTQNCFKYQGYLFSKPITISEFETLLTGKDLFANLKSQTDLSSKKPPPLN
jgi:diguanylate cyclase (GGDEF)-like protein